MTDPKTSAEDLFAEALEMPPERWRAFLDRACKDTPEMRHAVEELLEKHLRAGSFLASPALNPPETIGQAPIGRFLYGQVIAGRFAIVRFIARGGMGEVYEARDQLLQDTGVALKIIRPEIAADPAFAARFQQEVLLARKVIHPNLCPIYELFRCEEPAPAFLFLSMRLLQGQTLESRLREGKLLRTRRSRFASN